MAIADLRLNPHYVIWYKNVITIVTTLAVPVVLLGYWNFRTAQVLRRRQRLRDRPLLSSVISRNVELELEDGPTVNLESNSPPQQRQSSIEAKAEEATKAKILFVVVIMFMMFNVPRTILNIEELVVMLKSYSQYNLFGKGPSSLQCYNPPFWSRIMNCFSQFLLTLNGCVGSLIYCVMCSLFRAEVKSRFIAWYTRNPTVFRVFSRSHQNQNVANVEMEVVPEDHEQWDWTIDFVCYKFQVAVSRSRPLACLL